VVNSPSEVASGERINDPESASGSLGWFLNHPCGTSRALN